MKLAAKQNQNVEIATKNKVPFHKRLKKFAASALLVSTIITSKPVAAEEPKLTETQIGTKVTIDVEELGIADKINSDLCDFIHGILDFPVMSKSNDPELRRKKFIEFIEEKRGEIKKLSAHISDMTNDDYLRFLKLSPSKVVVELKKGTLKSENVEIPKEWMRSLRKYLFFKILSMDDLKFINFMKITDGVPVEFDRTRKHTYKKTDYIEYKIKGGKRIEWAEHFISIEPLYDLIDDLIENNYLMDYFEGRPLPPHRLNKLIRLSNEDYDDVIRHAIPPILDKYFTEPEQMEESYSSFSRAIQNIKKYLEGHWGHIQHKEHFGMLEKKEQLEEEIKEGKLGRSDLFYAMVFAKKNGYTEIWDDLFSMFTRNREMLAIDRELAKKHQELYDEIYTIIERRNYEKQNNKKWEDVVNGKLGWDGVYAKSFLLSETANFSVFWKPIGFHTEMGYLRSGAPFEFKNNIYFKAGLGFRYPYTEFDPGDFKIRFVGGVAPLIYMDGIRFDSSRGKFGFEELGYYADLMLYDFSARALAFLKNSSYFLRLDYLPFKYDRRMFVMEGYASIKENKVGGNMLIMPAIPVTPSISIGIPIVGRMHENASLGLGVGIATPEISSSIYPLIGIDEGMYGGGARFNYQFDIAQIGAGVEIVGGSGKLHYSLPVMKLFVDL